MPIVRTLPRRIGILLAGVAVAALGLVGATAAQAAPAPSRATLLWNSTLPVPSGVLDDAANFETPLLADLSCPGAGVCDFAENGQLASDSSALSYVIRRAANGSTSTVMMPGVGVNIQAMDCPRVDRCVAVGISGLPAGDWLPYAAIVTGTSVTVSALPPGAANQLVAVDCAGANHCLAVGEGTAYRLVGSAWTAVTLPTDFHAAAVKCISTTRCEIVGSVDFSDAAVADVRGSSVSITTVASAAQLPSFGNIVSAGIDCSLRGECVAVWRGYAADPNSSSWVGVSAIMRGGSWRIAALPTPKDTAAGSALSPASVGCTSTGCVVASTYQLASGGSDITFASEAGGRWTGTTPAHTTFSRTIGSAGPNDAGYAAPGAVCDGVGSCVFSFQSAGTLGAATVSGSTVGLTSVDIPSGAPAAVIAGIGCPYLGRCVAVAQTLGGWG